MFDKSPQDLRALVPKHIIVMFRRKEEEEEEEEEGERAWVAHLMFSVDRGLCYLE